jgi:hypothetical protein
MTCTAEHCAVQYPHTHEPAGMLGLEYGRPREPVLDMYYNPINERSCKPCEATRAKREPSIITGQRPPISFLKPPAQMPAVVSNLVPPGFSPPPMMEVFQRKPKDVPFEQKGKLESDALILVPEVSNKKAFPTPGTPVNPPSDKEKILEKKDDVVTVRMPEENKASDVMPILPAQTDTIQPAPTTLSVNLTDNKPNVEPQPRSVLCDNPLFRDTELCFAGPDGSYRQLPMCGSADMVTYISNYLIAASRVGRTVTVDELLRDEPICDAVKAMLRPHANRAEAAKVVADVVDGVKQIAESQGDAVVAAKAAETTKAGSAVWAPWMKHESHSASGMGDRSMIGSSTGKRSVDQRGRITLIGVPAGSLVFVNNSNGVVESFDRATLTAVLLHSPGFVFVEAETSKGDYMYGFGNLPARGNISIRLSRGQAQSRDRYLAQARGGIGELGIGPASGMGEWSMHGGRR